MNPNATMVWRSLSACAFSLLSFFNSNAQCIAPAMTWANPVLVEGVALQKDAVYKFPSVTPGVDAFIRVKDLRYGATLSSIDNTTFGYSAAWQPVVKTPPVQGASESWVEFKIEFKDSSDGKLHKYNCFQLSFIDVDGDNQAVQEFVAAKSPDHYIISNISILSVTNVSNMVKAMGTIGNYPNLDTTAYMTNINYRYYNQDMVDDVWVGNKTNASFVVQDRFTCGFFKQITMPWQSLPVTYTSFTASVANNNKVDLNWITANETNNSHFEVERSFGNGAGFISIGSVAKGTALGAGKQDYRHTDDSKELKGRGVIFYRLKQVDMDGKYTYSEVLAVKLQSNNNGSLQVFPNPFADKLELRFSVSVDAVAEIRITDINGKLILINRTRVNKGPVQVKVGGLQQLQPGAYIAQLVLDGKVMESQKVIKN